MVSGAGPTVLALTTETRHEGVDYESRRGWRTQVSNRIDKAFRSCRLTIQQPPDCYRDKSAEAQSREFASGSASGAARTRRHLGKARTGTTGCLEVLRLASHRVSRIPNVSPQKSALTFSNFAE